MSVDILSVKERLEELGMINQVPRTCFTCKWSIGSIIGLRCKLMYIAAESICDRYEREAGTEECEQ